MKVPHRQLTKTDVIRATDDQKNRIQTISRRALEFLCDPKKKERHEKQLCVCCFYGDKIGGAACTEASCGLCEKIRTFGSTYTDKLCVPCASDHGLCAHCGAGFNGVVSRSLNLEKI